MIKKPISLIVNAFLMVVLMGMVLLPPALTHLVATTIHTSPTVAGAEAAAGDFIVLPNFFDFGSHVTFNPVSSSAGYQDTLQLTAFRNQVATYHKLYTVINRANHSIRVRGMVASEPEPSHAYERVLITMVRPDDVHESQFAAAASEGDVHIVVKDGAVANDTDHLLVGLTRLPILAVLDDTIMTDPLGSAYAVDTVVHRGGIAITPEGIIRSRTTDIVLNPGESVHINVVVTGRNNVESQTFTVPLVIVPVAEE